MYAKINPDRKTLTPAPKSYGATCNPSAATHLAHGYKLVRPDAPPPAEEGHYVRPTGYDEDQTTIWRTYEQVPIPPPPRVFSKLKLEAALFEEGLMDQVDAFIDSQTVTNKFGQTMPLRRRYNTALEFSEDHPDFVKVFKALKQLLGVSDAKAEEILAASVKDS